MSRSTLHRRSEAGLRRPATAHLSNTAQQNNTAQPNKTAQPNNGLRPNTGLRLDDTTLAVLRSMLEQQREFRLDQLAQLTLPRALDALERPLSSTDPEILRELVAGARAALRDVQDALWRMAEGRYGQCVRCHEHIAVERLEILPQTALCVRCRRETAA